MTRCWIDYEGSNVKLKIHSDDLEIFALAKKLDDNAESRKEIIKEGQRHIFLRIEKPLGKIVNGE
jgi:hypothetical protein